MVGRLQGTAAGASIDPGATRPKVVLPRGPRRRWERSSRRTPVPAVRVRPGGRGLAREAPPRPAACWTGRVLAVLFLLRSSRGGGQLPGQGTRLAWAAAHAAGGLRGARSASLSPRVAEVTCGTPAEERLNRFPGCFPAAGQSVLRGPPRPGAAAAGAEDTRGVGVSGKRAREPRGLLFCPQHGSGGRQGSRRPLGRVWKGWRRRRQSDGVLV